jgi:hypothetical protein
MIVKDRVISDQERQHRDRKKYKDGKIERVIGRRGGTKLHGLTYECFI